MKLFASTKERLSRVESQATRLLLSDGDSNMRTFTESRSNEGHLGGNRSKSTVRYSVCHFLAFLGTDVSSFPSSSSLVEISFSRLSTSGNPVFLVHQDSGLFGLLPRGVKRDASGLEKTELGSLHRGSRNEATGRFRSRSGVDVLGGWPRERGNSRFRDRLCMAGKSLPCGVALRGFCDRTTNGVAVSREAGTLHFGFVRF